MIFIALGSGNFAEACSLKIDTAKRASHTLVRSVETVNASWYGRTFEGKLMANGKPFNMHKRTVAHKYLPLGSRVCVRNPKNGKEVFAVVTDRGPYVRGRSIDLSWQVAEDLGLLNRGVSRVQISSPYL
ncbi:MAG TPA: septal ring lytic transglycosylase RlpA family protein [Candidatus Paceibacterota bacterium]|nr:septal ring lytic transglycosylase RlpA family protein [Candidatus Paceibacterota bacterium]